MTLEPHSKNNWAFIHSWVDHFALEHSILGKLDILQVIFETQHPLLSKSWERFKKKKKSPTAHKNLTTVSASACSTGFHYLRLHHPSCTLSPAPSTFLYHKLLLKFLLCSCQINLQVRPRNLHSQNPVFFQSSVLLLDVYPPKIQDEKGEKEGREAALFLTVSGGFPHVPYHTHLMVPEKNHSVAASLHSLSIFSVLERHVEFSPRGR